MYNVCITLFLTIKHTYTHRGSDPRLKFGSGNFSIKQKDNTQLKKNKKNIIKLKLKLY